MAAKQPPTPPVLAVGELALEGEAASGTPPAAPGIPGRERADRIRTVVTYTVMFTVAALFFIPFLWSVSTSFRTIADTVQGFSLLPKHWTTVGYHEVFYK
jgi:ABC-type maltose transport system permease subunit